MNTYTQLANIIANIELEAYKKQLAYFKPLLKPRVLAYSVEDLMPKKIMLAKADKADLVALFYEPGPDRLFLHLVFSDEYFPNKVIDKIYREIRKLKFGRTADVESVEIRPGLIRMVNFVTTYCGPNVYETSAHFDGKEPFLGTLYIDTWNHLMSCLPSPAVLIRHGFKEAKDYIIREGTREDAEEFARGIVG